LSKDGEDILSTCCKTLRLTYQNVLNAKARSPTICKNAISELIIGNFDRYADLPGDFADLSLIAISERLNISTIATLDSDFDVYRRYRKQPLERVFFPQ
jgi:predicted nucleic acid-binding protein